MVFLARLNVLTALALVPVQQLWATVEHNVIHAVQAGTYQELSALVSIVNFSLLVWNEF